MSVCESELDLQICSSPEPEVAELRAAEPDVEPSQRRGRQREKKRPLLIVKFDFKRKLDSKKTKEEKTQTRKSAALTGPFKTKPAAAKKLTGACVCRPASNGVTGDVFTFSEKPQRKTKDEKEKVKVAVLRTISKMLEENQVIRQRLTSLSRST